MNQQPHKRQKQKGKSNMPLQGVVHFLTNTNNRRIPDYTSQEIVQNQKVVSSSSKSLNAANNGAAVNQGKDDVHDDDDVEASKRTTDTNTTSGCGLGSSERYVPNHHHHHERASNILKSVEAVLEEGRSTTDLATATAAASSSTGNKVGVISLGGEGGNVPETANTTAANKTAIVQKQSPTDNVDTSDNRSISSSTSQSTSTSSSISAKACISGRPNVIATLILIAGMIASGMFIYQGVTNETHEQQVKFDLIVDEFVVELQSSWNDYETTARWIHQSCSSHQDHLLSHNDTKSSSSHHNIDLIPRNEFRGVYEYATTGLDVQAVEWIPKVPQSARQVLEDDSRAYYKTNYPTIDYQGIRGFELGFDGTTTSLQERSKQPFYYPVHYVEPVVANAAAIGFDLWSSPQRRALIQQALDTWKPSISKPIQLLQNQDNGSDSKIEENAVLLFHPGIQLSNIPNQQPQDLALIVIRMKSIIQRATMNLQDTIRVYIYDSSSTTSSTSEEQEQQPEPDFLIGAKIKPNNSNPTFLPKQSMESLITGDAGKHPLHHFIKISNIQITPKSSWTIVATPCSDEEESFTTPQFNTALIGGSFIFIVCVLVALWLRSDLRRTRKLHRIKRKADMEKSALILQKARESAKAEQELNNYIAHEVRNPLAAAMSACSFVKSSLVTLSSSNSKSKSSSRKQYKPKGIDDDEEKVSLLYNNNNNNKNEDTTTTMVSIREDVDIIDSSLEFINDLLRSMLDIQRAQSKKIHMELTPVDIYSDVLQPVASLLYRRGTRFDIQIDCEPKSLIVMTDRLRFKQIMLNLGRNSVKFVKQGYIKLNAYVSPTTGTVQVTIEDSGPGIPEAKREHLFSKFQESLDSMNQGTGLGLCLCTSMIELLKGEIWLDESFVSNVENCPGTRFVVDLKVPPLSQEECDLIVGEQHNEMMMMESRPLFASGTEYNNHPPPHNNNPPQQLSNNDDHVQLSSSSPSPPSIQQVSIPATIKQEQPQQVELPENLSVLFVDDDMVLRKLFMRSVRKVAGSSWNIQEAANGETAISKVVNNNEKFDIIFMDQYMASVTEKQLLGTETTKALRDNGVKSVIVGLSANDIEQGFMDAGADCFIFKPIPCRPDDLKKELFRILSARRRPTLSSRNLLDGGDDNNNDVGVC